MRLFGIVVVLFSCRGMLGQDISLRFGVVHPTKTVTVEFTVISAGTVPAEAMAALNVQEVQTDSHNHTLLVDLQSLKRGKFDRFTIDVYLRKAQKPGEAVSKFVVAEDPTGSFRDQRAPVPFYVVTATGDDPGTVSLPLHSAYGSDNLSIKPNESPLPVGLGGPSMKNIPVTSNLDNLRTTVNSVSLRSECVPCWRSLSASIVQGTLSPQGTTSLSLSLHPNSLVTLFSKAMIMKPDKSQDTVLVDVSSTSEQGGAASPQEFSIPIRFTPSWLALSVCVFLGAGLGAFLGWLIVSSTPGAAPFVGKTTIAAVGMAFVVWLVSLTAFSLTDTRVVIGGVSLDPTQLIPAFLISLFAAGGTPVTDRIQRVWSKP
jgi:hypothetical protein